MERRWKEIGEMTQIKEKRSKRNEMFLKRCFLRTYHDVAVDEGYFFHSLKYFPEICDRIIIIFITALHTFVGLWPLFQFLDLIQAGRTL
jgi:hypothetical protein